MIKLLAIEDDNVDFNLLKRLVEKNIPNSEILQANTQTEALSLLEKDNFTCVILDYMLPDANGLETISVIKEVHPEIPILFVTAYGDELTATKSVALGAINYFAKDKIEKEEKLFVNCVLNSISEFQDIIVLQSIKQQVIDVKNRITEKIKLQSV